MISYYIFCAWVGVYAFAIVGGLVITLCIRTWGTYSV